MVKTFSILILLLIVSISGKCTDSTNIYSLSITCINGSTINLNDFRDKKILFVNIATRSENSNQLSELEQLYQQYQDSLVIIAFPSNDFGNEPDDDSTIQSTVKNLYDNHYILAAKSNITGDSQNAVFKWITNKSLNGIFDNPVESDFYKFVVDRQGQLTAVFNETLHLNDAQIQNAIAN